VQINLRQRRLRGYEFQEGEGASGGLAKSKGKSYFW